MKIYNLFLFHLFLVLCAFKVYAVTIGSDTTVSREGLASFSSVDNEMLGFAAFEAGFELQDASTTCSFDSFYPVSGDITFNGGTLFLFQDFVLSNTVKLFDAGIINGRCFEMSFPFTDTLDLPGFTFEDIVLHLGGKTVLNGDVTFIGEIVIDGHGNKIDMNGFDFIVSNSASLSIKGVEIEGISGNQIRCLDSLGTITLQDVKWVQNGDYSLDNGHFDFFGEVVITGSGVFAYRTDEFATLDSYSKITLESGMTFSYDPSIANNSLLVMTDTTSVLSMHNSTLFATSTGLQLTQGTLEIDGKVVLESEATVQAEGIVFGDGSDEDNDLQLVVMPEASIEVNSGYFVYANVA